MGRSTFLGGAFSAGVLASTTAGGVSVSAASGVSAGSASSIGGRLFLLGSLVSWPARLNCTSPGSFGTPVSRVSFLSKPGAGGATGTISSVATSWAKNRVGSSSPPTGASTSFLPNRASHSRIDCGRSVGLDRHAGIDRLQETLAEPGPVALGQRRAHAAMHPLEHFGRFFAGHALVEHDRRARRCRSTALAA